ncbi:hypothetical protein CMI47_18570 [Candidatus Pacearchaeota archaeon]|nr:hypothetical protein [Candidatus Pacearchaeota archaeon]|tara:strand:- start:11 stop:517 length:507 start_codon:yes stop_codon:yes gene_type:complete
MAIKPEELFQPPLSSEAMHTLAQRPTNITVIHLPHDRTFRNLTEPVHRNELLDGLSDSDNQHSGFLTQNTPIEHEGYSFVYPNPDGTITEIRGIFPAEITPSLALGRTDGRMYGHPPKLIIKHGIESPVFLSNYYYPIHGGIPTSLTPNSPDPQEVARFTSFQKRLVV